MVDVAGGAERQRPRRSSAGSARRGPPRPAARARRRARCAGRAAPRPSWIRATTGGSPARRAAASAGADRGRAQRDRRARRARSAAARRRRPGRRSRTTRAAGPICRRQRLGRRFQLGLGPLEHRQRRDLAPGPRRVAVQAQRRLQRGQRQLVDPQRPGERMARGRRRSPSRVPSRSPACGPPSSLSPEQQTSAAPAATERAQRRLIGERGQPVGERPEPTSSITGTPESRTAPRSRPPARSRACGSSTGARAGSRAPGESSARS